MATTTETRVKPAEGEKRFVLYNVGWEGYQTLLDLVGDRGVRLTYDRGNVELMSPLIMHERFGNLLGRMVEAITEELDIQAVGAGSTTFKSQALDRGLEPDECYYIASVGRFRDVDRPDLSVDPPPDLAIEVEITQSALNKLGIYAALGVPEVWRFDGESLKVLLLRPDGSYTPSPTSLSFPFLALEDIARFVREYEPNDDTRWARGFRAWVREVLAPRYEQWRAERREDA
jgi:Uma2 family endonuclease